MKECTRCKETKDLNEFRRRAGNHDGLQYHCGVCQDTYGLNLTAILEKGIYDYKKSK
jgi:hypothetical protein